MKRMLTLLTCLAFALSLPCCVGLAEEETGQNETVAMQDICDANSYQALTWKYALTGINIINYAADGTETDSQYFAYGQNGDILFENSDGYSEYYNGSDRAFLYDRETNQFSVRIFLDDAERTAYVEAYRRMIVYNEAEVIESSVEEEGQLAVTTSLPLSEEAAANYESALGLEDVSSLQFVYALDPETLEIAQCTANVIAGGSQIPISTVRFSYSDEALTPPEFVDSLANPESTRTVTVVYNDVTTEYVIASNALLRYVVPDGYEAYADADKTLPAETEEADGSDATVYLFPIEKAADAEASETGN